MNCPNIEQIAIRAEAALTQPCHARHQIINPCLSCDADIQRSLRSDIPELIAHIKHLEAVVEAVAAIHTPHAIYDQCDHEHTADEIGTRGVVDVGEIGLTCEKMYDICSECCVVRDDGSQSETCATYHTHGLDLPICKTSAALRACGYKEPTE